MKISVLKELPCPPFNDGRENFSAQLQNWRPGRFLRGGVGFGSFKTSSRWAEGLSGGMRGIFFAIVIEPMRFNGGKT